MRDAPIPARWVQVPVWSCQRCGHEWAGQPHGRPAPACPRCHRSGWWRVEDEARTSADGMVLAGMLPGEARVWPWPDGIERETVAASVYRAARVLGVLVALVRSEAGLIVRRVPGACRPGRGRARKVRGMLVGSEAAGRESAGPGQVGSDSEAPALVEQAAASPVAASPGAAAPDPLGSQG